MSTGRGGPAGSPGPVTQEPTFQFHLVGQASESYVTNAYGYAGTQSPDYLSTIGLNATLHEHSRRVTLDANYGVTADFYAKGTYPTQVYNNLQALGTVDVVPEYLTLNGRAFAQPVILSDYGAVTANNRVVPNAYRNGYGYFVNPDLKFLLGDFAVSETVPSFGQVFFGTPPGGTATPVVPGLLGAQDTTMRSLMERISSGTYFSRFNWSLVGLASEVDRPGSLLSEKTAVSNLSYAASYEFSLLATGGYDHISDTTGLFKDVSGPVLLGGFGLTYGEDFELKIEAGTKYNSASLYGNLRYNLTPTSALVASADDYVQTPEGQLLNNLTNLTALNNGSLVSGQSYLGNGSSSSLSPYSIQSPGNPSLDQNVSRYQIAQISYLKEFQRDHVNLGVFGTRRTFLNGVFIGPSTVDYWGGTASYAHNFTPLLTGTVAGTYTLNKEFGGNARLFSVEGTVNYSLSRETGLYLRADYRERTSSAFTGVLSPFAGNASDLRVTAGLSHQFW